MGRFQDEQEMLDHYDSSKYRTPDGYTSDILLFTIVDKEAAQTKKETKATKELRLMLIKRADKDAENEPNVEGGKWAVPGGFVMPNESSYEAALRELQEETGVENVHVKHFGTYDEPGRDKRGWIISNAFYAIIPEFFLENRKAADDAVKVELFTMEEIDHLDIAFDHREIIEDAKKQITKDMLQTDIAKRFLAKEFTISELQSVILAVYYHKSIDSDNFYKKVDKLGFIEVARDRDKNMKTTTRNSKRPSRLYQFIEKAPLPSIYF
ncbi:NUDIX hydrolase [Radiobacillus kanasensis]|uniref:NUDIX hydrolase n=1 Tax=Radiobacillus kanasensis TaxID=2844358 RepID=UPI001E62A6CE|nr:NUDIX domain-containing protein [Radiobacillus kanasensis]UFT99672.1 NUDIX hydrolase [Radiobacillus kanasensis]